MKKFRKISIKPLRDFASLNLSISEKKYVNLGELTPEVRGKLNEAFNVLRKSGEGIVATGDDNNGLYISSIISHSKNKNQNVVFQEPNPIQIYYVIANEHLEKAYNIRSKLINPMTIEGTEHYRFLVEYIKEVSQGIIFLITTIEGFINQGIQAVPEEYQFYKEIDGKVYEIRKEEVEWYDFNTKVKLIVPAITGKDYSILFPVEYDLLTKLDDLRNDLTHLKLSLKKNFTSYEDLNKRLLDFNPHIASETVFHFINTLISGYFVEDNNGL